MVKFKKVSYDTVKVIRDEYFDSIYEVQELYMELLVEEADYYIIELRDIIGYFIITQEGVLIEFYLTIDNIRNCQSIFKKIISDYNISRVYCKSFDSVLLKCCLKNSASHKVIGTLFRDFTNTDTDEMEGFSIKTASDTDIHYLLEQTDGLYESEKELMKLVKAGNINMYLFEGQLIGCGFLIKILNKRNFYDIGMWVNPIFRKMGYASRIIANLKGYCLKNNMIPTCGCASDNIASQRVLEKNGFISKHDLVEFLI